MTLKLNELMEKAEKKGYSNPASKKEKEQYRPWQQNYSDDSETENLDKKSNQKKSPSQKNTESVHQISTSDIINWDFHDRPESELGDISALAKDFLNIGQQQPCIVRQLNGESDKKQKFELIVGERRWRAAQSVKLPLKVIIKDLTDNEAALIQATENDNREDLSDFAKGMSFSRLIDKGIIKQKDLTERLGKSRQYVSALLSFSKIPPEIIEAIGDMSKVSARTAETIKQLSAKGDGYIAAIIQKADSIRQGKLGNKSMPLAIERALMKKQPEKETNKKIFSSDGRHVFTWRYDNNDLPSIHFPKNIIQLINDGRLDLTKITSHLTSTLEKELNELKN